MPNLTALLKAEITRLARKEVRAGTSKLLKAVASHRSEIAALKRRSSELEQQLRQAQRGQRTSVTVREAPVAEDGSARTRYSAKSLIAQRKRLGLSAADVGLLFGTTGQSVYNWESGRARPSVKHMATLAALRNLGKRQAAEIVAARRGR
jgi:DNA-binding transcriptional regulator YiaG